MYEPPGIYPYDEEQRARDTIIAKNQAIRLTCTLAAMSTLFALFLCFADQRSRAVRRYAVQSVGLGALVLALGMICWILSAILGAIPIVGFGFFVLLIILLVVGCVISLVFRVRMMLHAYRGRAYVLPRIGEKLRRFE